MKISSTFACKIGVACYVVWGLLHFQAAYGVYALGQNMEPGMAQGRVYQDAWSLVFFAAFAIGLAVTLNWRNSRWGYWINFGIISVTDIGFILFILVPGLAPMWTGILGPVFWVLGWIFTTIALVRDKPVRTT
jgi:hypothetical protein